MESLPSVELSVTNGELGHVYVANSHGKPWILAKTICETLGYKNIYAMLSRYVSKENKKKIVIEEFTKEFGMHAPTLFVNQEGLGQILLHARANPKAVQMKEWIFGSLLKRWQEEQRPVAPIVHRQVMELDPSYAEALQKLHRNQCALYQQNKEINETLKTICNVITDLLTVFRIDGMNWRSAANAIVKCGDSDQIPNRFHELYQMLEQVSHVNLKVRRSNLQEKHPGKKISTLDAIAEDKQLVECFITILRRYALTHGINVKINSVDMKGAA